MDLKKRLQKGQYFQFLRATYRKRKFKLVFGMSCFILMLILLISIIESRVNEAFRSVVDVLYWAVVTISTVGYGDITVHTFAAKVLAVLMIMTGVLLVSLMTATFASIFTTTRIREGMGLKKIEFSNHVVICGFNANIERVVQGVIDSAPKSMPDIVLVNNHQESEISAFIERFPGISISFVSGDYTSEAALLRAGVTSAASVIILADEGPDENQKPDEKTLLSTLTIKSVSKDLTVCAEVIAATNVPHLKRAGVDQIVVSGEFSGFLLANAVMSPGITQAFREIIHSTYGSDMRREEMPRELAGKTFKTAVVEFIERYGFILVGVVTEKKTFNLENVLSGESSEIDDFIRRKFDEAGRSLEIEAKGWVTVNINPGMDYIITENDHAIVITPKHREVS